MAQWAVILGGSSGFGLATAEVLAERGFHLFIIHRDRRSFARGLGPTWEAFKAKGVHCEVRNANALDAAQMAALVKEIQEAAGSHTVQLLMHSIAQGNVKPLAGHPDERLTADDFQQTIYAMGTSWREWTQALLDAGLFANTGRTLALTSEGSQLAGQHYAAVGAAKATLEALCKYMANEYARFGIRSNLINAGVTRTRALEGIPGHEAYLAAAQKRNPLGRLTTPEDVAKVIALLAQPEADWINGATIRVDGGEQISGW